MAARSSDSLRGVGNNGNFEVFFILRKGVRLLCERSWCPLTRPVQANRRSNFSLCTPGMLGLEARALGVGGGVCRPVGPLS